MTFKRWVNSYIVAIIKTSQALPEMFLLLFLPDENIHRYSMEVPLGTDFIFEETLVRFFYILRQVGEEYERWHAHIGQLHTVFNFDIFAFC